MDHIFEACRLERPDGFLGPEPTSCLESSGQTTALQLWTTVGIDKFSTVITVIYLPDLSTVLHSYNNYPSSGYIPVLLQFT